jgi:GTP:adenosylcobinamide-phosphate guanylyltransferase
VSEVGVCGAVVLAGQRAGPTPLCAQAGVDVEVLVPVGGVPAIERVLGALSRAERVRPAAVVGPSPAVLSAHPEVKAMIDAAGAAWVAPARDPASSALAGLQGQAPPTLVTSGDHALLSAPIVDAFCEAAHRVQADLIVGLVPYEAVRAAYPESRRTVLKFADGARCGANLYLLRTEEARRGIEFWVAVQRDRKRPWRIARRLGWRLLLRYLAGRLTLDAALEALSERAGCRVGSVIVDEPRAAVDVDSVDDWRLAQRIVGEGS